MLYRVENIRESIPATDATSARQQSHHKAISIFPRQLGPAKARGLKFKSFRCTRDRFKFAKFRGAGVQLFDGSVRKKQRRRGDERVDERVTRADSIGANIHRALNIKRTSKSQKSLDFAGLA